MGKIKTKISDEAEGCFTSMIDIVFLLLIYFVCQPFKAPELRMLAFLPKDSGRGSGAAVDPKPTITLRINGSDRGDVSFMIGDREFKNGNMIGQALLQESGGDTSVPVALEPGPNVHFNHVLKALDQCNYANMTDVKFAAKF